MELETQFSLEVLKTPAKKCYFFLIQAEERKIVYYAGQTSPHKTRRWMRAEDWAAVTKILSNFSTSDALNQAKKQTIRINSILQVRIKQSTISVDALCKTTKRVQPEDVLGAFDCKIEHHDYNNNKSSKTASQTEVKDTTTLTPQKQSGSTFLEALNEKRNLRSHSTKPESVAQEHLLAESTKSRTPSSKKKAKFTDLNLITSESENEIDETLTKAVHHGKRDTQKKFRSYFKSDTDDHDSNSQSRKKAKKSEHTKTPKGKKELEKANTKSATGVQEQHTISKWLGKTEATKKYNANLEELVPELKSASSSSLASNDCDTFEARIKRTQAQAAKNREVTEILKALKKSDPEEVEVLDLFKLSSEDILNSFDEHRSVLEEAFQELKSEYKFANYLTRKSISYYLISSLLPLPIQNKMMDKLSLHYEKNDGGPPRYAELFSSVMLPEWTIEIFMKHYSMSREAAIKHIKAQKEYKDHQQSEDVSDIFDF